MLLCGTNVVGYTNYYNNAVHKFCKQASKSGVDILCVFDSLNYTENLKIGIDAVGSTSRVMEVILYYIGGILDPNKGKCDIGYYINLTSDLNDMGVYYIAVEEMAGLLNPRAATMLVSALREEIPGMPLNMTLQRLIHPPRLCETL